MSSTPSRTSGKRSSISHLNQERMRDSFLEEEYKGCKISLLPDMEPMDPRDDENLGIMACRHRDYILGDPRKSDPFDFMSATDMDDLNDKLKKADVIWMPLYLLDHSGLWMHTSRFLEDPHGWDTSFVGIIYVTKQKVREEFGLKLISKKTLSRVISILEAEVKTYSSYLSGAYYGYVAEDGEGEHISSCWGFCDDTEEVLQQAREEIDAFLLERRKKHETKLKAKIINRAPLQARMEI